jgi:hypothetical protein
LIAFCTAVETAGTALLEFHGATGAFLAALDELEELIPSLLVRKFSKALTGVAEPEFDPELVPEAVRSPSAVCPW